MVGKVLYIKYKEIVDGQIVEKVRYAVDRWQADDKYMGESFITFTIKSPKPIAFSVGDYCEYRGETYTLNYIPSVSQKANIGGSGEAFVYEQIKMDSPREELDRVVMLDVTPTTGDYVAALGTNYTGSSQFQLYCGETTANGKTLTPVCALAAKIQANLDRAFPGRGWKVLVDTTSTHEEAGQQVLNTHSDEKTLTFDNTTIANALAEVKNTFEIDFAVKGRTIYIGYTFGAITGNDDGSYYYFGYGKGYLSEDNQGKALFELKRMSDSGQKIVTRLRALGSTKNMPYRYYNKKYNLSQSLFPTNLQLPDTFETPATKAKHNKERKAVYPWIRDVLGDTNDAYIDKNDNCLDTVEGLREDCMRWDGTNADLKEIYPSIEEVTYGELRAALCEDQDGNKGASAFPYYGDNERVDEILAIDTDTNVGDGILTESDSTRQTASDTDVRLTSSETSSSLAYNGSAYASKEVEVMSIASQYAGNYIISNSHLWFRASYSLGRHQSENITKTCKVAYRIKVYAKDLSTNKESVICTYISDYKQISNRQAKEYEVEIAKLPDVDAEVQKVDRITVTNPSDIRITFALLVMDIDYTYDQWNVNWNLGLSLYQNPDTDTEWTPSLIWDLEGSASTFMKNPFHVYVKDMGFDFVAAFGTSDTPKIAMKSGMCVAREFTIGNNPQKVEYTKNGITYKAWRLTLAKAEDSSLKTYYPSENFPLAAGDNFVIIGIEMPDVYIQAASMKLLVEATKALADVCDTKHEYEPSVDDIYIQRNYDRCEEQGDVTKSVYWKLGAGMKFPFFGIAEEGKETPDMFSMIIDTLSIREGEGLTPKITIKLSEDFQQSTLQKLTRTVTSITNGSIFKATSIDNGGGLDESSVRAIVSEFTKRRYLSKLNDDVAAGIITFLKGTNWGNFTSETGAAMTIDPTTGQTYMEVDRLKVRLKAFFEQLEVQKVGYVGGKIVVSKGQGVNILDVEEIYDSEGNLSAYRCYFLGEQEGRRINNLLRVDDQMICKDENISEGSTDGATNKYYWRLATAVSSDVVKRGNNVCHWVDLSATDCDTNSDIPEIGDTICHLGNREDINRQGAEVLSVVDANSPSFTIYSGINSYSLVNKEYIDMGVAGGKAFCNIYGSTYIGDRNRENGYISWDYDKEENVWKMRVKGTIDITSQLSSGGTIGGAIDNAANAYKDDFSSFTSNVNEIIGGFQAQIDGVIETWFFDKDNPELTDEPAVNWTDNDTKKRHLGDLYYSKSGLAYRFQKEGDIYKWVQIDDTAITSALKEAKAAKDAAAAAQGTADTAQNTAKSKMKVFVNTPTDSDEYSIGDMWVNATYPADGSTYNNEILHCVTKKAAGEAFSISHWAQSSNIKTQFNNFVNNTYAEDKKDFYNQLDGKVETWYQKDDPKDKWAAADYSKHKGDIWYNDTTNKSYRWTGTAWVELKDQAAIDAKALAESKRRVFTTTTLPTPPYDAKDLWVQGENGDIMVCVTPKAAGTTASASDWAKASKYTDDSALNTFINEYKAQIADFSHQLDGKIETWYYPYVPTTSNAPADGWTADEKTSHSGDLFYNTATGVAYRWTGTAWEILKDKEVQTALDNAKTAQDTADNKRRVFLSQPTVPYDAGDLWVSDTTNGKVTKVCVNGKTTGTFSTEDWKESDDAALNSFSATITESIKGIESQLDKKAETWYQASKPGTDWTPEQKAEHKGDLWYNTTNHTTWYYDGTEWVQQNIPTDVFDKIDGKAAIYVSKPSSYRVNDLWILEAAYTLSGVSYTKGTLVVATATSNTFNAAHWTEKVKYTDDTAAKAAQTTANAAAAVAQGINNAINAIDNNVDVALKDKIITKTEAAAIKEALNSLSAIMADVNKTKEELVNNAVYKNIAADVKTDYDTAYTNLKAAYNELSKYINDTLLVAKTITDEILSTYTTKFSTFKTKYEDYVSKLNVVRNSMDALLNTRIGDIASMLGGLKATQDAMDETTQINGGLILSTLLALGYTDSGNNFNVMSGVSGLYESDTEKGGGIAFWAGGHRIDINDCTKNADGTYSLGGKVVNPADFLVRHDGTGYAAGGALWWEKDGKVHADPQSFIINKQYVGNVMQLFEFGYSGGTAFENIVHAIPQKPFESLSVGANGLTLYNGEKTAKLYIKNGVLFIEGDLAVTGGITMYASDGVKSGMIDQVYAVLDQSLFSIVDGMITITGEIGSGTVKGIAIKGTQYDPDNNGIIALTLNWDDLVGVPTTFMPSAHIHDDRYYTESEMDTMLGGKSDTSHTHSLKINGVTKIIEATGGTAVDLGTYLTVHQPIYALTISGKDTNTFTYTPNSSDAALTITPAWIGAPTTSGTGATGTWGISISGNAATATKLAATKTLWGQNFDGSVNVSGNMSSVGSITPTGDTLKIVGNLIVTGGITMYATDGTFDSAFGQQLANFVDNVTIKFVNDKLVAVNNGNVTSIIISGTEYKPTDGAVTLPDLFAPSAHKHAIVDVNGLQDILNKKLDTSLKGTANGLATLDESGKVPSAQLPSYVDDVLEYTNKASFPTTGESGKIYIDQTTNLTYRWGGSAYVEISQSLALGETSSTAYAGDKGKKNATDIAALKTGKADKATTLAGYGITNAYTKDETDGKYLALAGGTMTGVISSTFASNTWINGVTNAIIKASYTGYGSVLSMPVYGGRVSISSYPGSENDNHIYFTYATAEQIAAGDNSVPMVRMSWDAATNTLAAAVFQGALSGNASSATKLLNARTLWGQSFDGSANVSGAITGASDITMSGALKLNGITISKTSNGLLKIDGDLIVTGGITMYASDGVKSGLMEQILVDGVTIDKNSDGALYAINTGNVRTIKMGTVEYTPNDSGVVELPAKVTWDNIDGKPSTFTPSAHTHTFASLTDKPTTISGYGITDAKIANGVITLGTATITPLTAHQKVTLASGTNNGTLKLTVNGTDTDNIAVKGLGSAAFTASSAYAAASHTHSQYLVASSLDGYVNALTDNTSTNVFVTAISKSGKTLSYTKSFTKKSLTAVSHSGWKGDGSDELTIPDMSFIAYWNGAYNSSGGSNLAYCNKGAFGDMATAAKSSYYTKSEVNTKLTDGSVTKLGTANVGATNIPIYLKAGVPTAVTLVDTANNLINNLAEGTSTPVDADYYVAQYVGGGTTTTTFHRRPHSALYAYIKGKAEGTWAISVTGNAATATTLQNARTLWGQSFNGSANISGNMSGVGQITFSDLTGTNGRSLLYQKMADNDYFRIYTGGTASNGGYVEIATADDGTEPIYVRQYSGIFTTLTRTLTLLDGNGNTSLPGTLTAPNATISTTLKVGAIPVTNSSTGILKIDGNLVVTGGITMYASDGVASGLMEQILVDGVTIDKDANGRLYAINTGNVRSIIMGSTTYTPNDSGAVTLPEKVTWANIEGKPSTFTPSAHTHAISQITNLQATLDGKAAASHTHSYLPLSGGTMTGALNVRTGGIWVQGGSEAGSDNTRMSLVSGMPSGLAYNTSKRGVRIYSNAIALADPYNGNSNNDAGWIRHLETTANSGLLEIAVGDDGNESIVARQYNTNSAVVREAYLLNSSGNTSFPGTVTAPTFSGALSGNASSATKLQTARSIFGKNFDGSADIGGQGLFYGTYKSTANERYYNSALQIRENGLVTANQSDLAYAPSIGFHWGGRTAATLLYGSDGIFYLRKQDFATRASLDANLVGNAATASKWSAARKITLTGSVTGSVSIDGSGDVTLATTTNHTHNYAGSASAGGAADSSNCLLYTGTGSSVITAYQTGSAFMGSDDSWASYIICNHGDGSSYYNQTIRMPFWGVPQYQRLVDGKYSGWKTFITSENIGSQSVNYAVSAGSVRSESGNKIYGLQYYSGNGTFTKDGTDVGGAWSIPSESSGAQFGNGQAIRMWFNSAYYTDILSTPNGWGAASGLYIRQISNDAIPEGTFTGGWRLLLDSLNYNRYVPSLTGTGASGTWGISISGNASTATNADKLDGEHSSAFAHIGAHNNLMAAGNEFTFASSGFSGGIYLNYRTAGGTNGNITEYILGNGAGGSLGTIIHSGNYNDYAPTKTGTGASGTWGISVSGNAATASKWATARTITLSGSVTGSVSIDGSGNVTLETTTNHTHSYLPLAGGTMTGTINANDNTQNTGIKFKNNNANLNALSNQHLILGSAIRFGDYNTWDWNVWAGLKYDSSSKTIYLGLADGTTFNANSAQSGGTLKFPGVSELYMNADARISHADGNLYLGRADNYGWVMCQDMCSQSGSTYWRLTQAGYLTAKGVILSEKFSSSVSSSTYLDANKGKAIINSTAAAGFNMLARMKSTNGVFIHGVYDNAYKFYYTADGVISEGTNEVSHSLLSLGEDGYVSSNNLVPLRNAAYTFGLSSNRWLRGFFSNALHVGAANSTATNAVANCSQFGPGYIELSHSTPFIDFHYNKDKGNYTSRIVATGASCLAITSNLYIGGSSDTSYKLRVNGQTHIDGALESQGTFVVLGSAGPVANIDQSGNITANGGITMYSDLRKKNILSDEVLSVKEIAAAPLFRHTYKSDDNQYIHVGTSAQYWSGIHEDWFTRKDGEGYYQMELQNLGVAMGISLAREIVTFEGAFKKYESKTDKKIRLMKKKINDLEARIKELEGSMEERRTA